MSKTDDGRLDAAIDRTVQEMLDVEPPAGLRRRVVERIERPRRVVPRWTWALAPAMAMIVLAIVLPSRQRAVVRVHGVVAVKTPLPVALPGPVASATAATTTVPTVTDRTVRTTSANRARVIVATSAPTAASDGRVDPLSPIDPIGIVPVRSASIAPSGIAIAPLAPIAALQLEPLLPPDRR